MTIVSGRIAASVLSVSTSDSPFETLEPCSEIDTVSAPRRLAAISKLVRVRVEASKNRLTIVFPRNVSRFIGEVRRHFNCIIVDVPAITGNPETKVIASLCDGVVLVIETARTKREVALRSKDTLTSSGARILGTVLNKRKYVIPDLLYKRI